MNIDRLDFLNSINPPNVFNTFNTNTFGMDNLSIFSTFPTNFNLPNTNAFNFSLIDPFQDIMPTNYQTPQTINFDFDKLYKDFTNSLDMRIAEMSKLFASMPIGVQNTKETGKTNEEKIAKLAPEMQNKVRDLLAYAKTQGLNVKITSGFRTLAEQQQLLKTRQNFAAKNSLHCRGKAIDISITNGTNSDYKKLGDYAKSIGLRWGGDFKKVPERWHFDLGWS